MALRLHTSPAMFLRFLYNYAYVMQFNENIGSVTKLHGSKRREKLLFDGLGKQSLFKEREHWYLRVDN